jgi:hypothetical protein
MDSFVWLTPALACPACGDKTHGVRILCAVEVDGEVGFFIVCTHCHYQIVSSSKHDDFWDMINGVPPNETEN